MNTWLKIRMVVLLVIFGIGVWHGMRSLLAGDYARATWFQVLVFWMNYLMDHPPQQ